MCELSLVTDTRTVRRRLLMMALARPNVLRLSKTLAAANQRS